VKLARTERDSLRLRNDELLQSNAEKTADFIRAAGAEKNAVLETNSLRNELQTALRDHGAAVTAPGETVQVTAITATLTARCETAERKVSNLRAELGEVRIAFPNKSQHCLPIQD
jgi:seryl-tRNA synthetase